MCYQPLSRNLFIRFRHYRGAFGLVSYSTSVDIVPLQPTEEYHAWLQVCRLYRERTIVLDGDVPDELDVAVLGEDLLTGVNCLNLTGTTSTTPFALQSDKVVELDDIGLTCVLKRYKCPDYWIERFCGQEKHPRG